MLNQKIVYLCLFLVVTSCTDQEQKLPEPTTVKNPDQEGWNSTIRATKEGRLEAIVRYGHMERYNDQKRIFFDQGITVDFYGPNEKLSSTLRAREGELDEKSNDVKASGNVVVESDTGITLFTEELFYDQQAQLIISNKEVAIITADRDTLYGQGLRSNPQLTEYTLVRLHGKAHRGVDLSNEAWKRPSRKETEPDTVSARRQTREDP
jgi:LPS export ABC transporter protein LptC